MAFEQKTNHAMEIAGNCLYLQFQRVHTGPCGCGRRFMPRCASPALLGTKRMEQIRVQICTHLRSLRGSEEGCHAARQQWKVSHLRSPCKSQEAWGPPGGSPAPRNKQCGGNQPPDPSPLPPRNPPPSTPSCFFIRFLHHQH